MTELMNTFLEHFVSNTRWSTRPDTKAGPSVDQFDVVGLIGLFLYENVVQVVDEC